MILKLFKETNCLIPCKSFIQSIMKYYDYFTIQAIKYGLAMKLIARKDYFN